jgi:tripartite-type tricarboxylate transporter receptor subunit TctC
MTTPSIPRRQLLQLGATALAASACGVRAQAPGFPTRALKLVIAFPAGGPTDITMRSLADNASRVLGQPVIVENKPGAGGSLPAQALQSAAADGYTLAQIPLGVFRLPYTTKINWDPIKDISYVINVTGYAFGVVVPSDSPLRNWAQFVAWARANPGQLTYGSTGTLTSPHLTMELIAQKLGLSLQHIPYKGSAELAQAIVGGHVMAAADSTGFAPLVEAGKIRVLNTWGAERLAKFPEARHRAELALRHWRAPGHTGARGQGPARRLQAGHGAGRLPHSAGALRHAADLYGFGRLHPVCPGHLCPRKAAGGKTGPGQAAVA